MVRNHQAQTQTPEPGKEQTPGDLIAARMLAAFKSDEYLTDVDLMRAASVNRRTYVQVRKYLLTKTYELEIVQNPDGAQYPLYRQVKPRTQGAGN